MNDAYIFIGTNINRETNYLEALRRLKRLGRVLRASSVYLTMPVGGRGDDFLNGAVLLQTDLRAHELKQALAEIEAGMGRVRTGDRYAPRTIDLDLVLYNRENVDDGRVRVPDPLIFTRAFLAAALAELTPGYVVPGAGETLAEIARRFGPTPGEMRLEPEMTRRVRDFVVDNQIEEVANA